MYDGYEGLTFECSDSRAFQLDRNAMLKSIKWKNLSMLKVESMRHVSSITYKFSALCHHDMCYQGFRLFNNNDASTMICYHNLFSSLGMPELYVEFKMEKIENEKINMMFQLGNNGPETTVLNS